MPPVLYRLGVPGLPAEIGKRPLQGLQEVGPKPPHLLGRSSEQHVKVVVDHAEQEDPQPTDADDSPHRHQTRLVVGEHELSAHDRQRQMYLDHANLRPRVIDHRFLHHKQLRSRTSRLVFGQSRITRAIFNR